MNAGFRSGCSLPGAEISRRLRQFPLRALGISASAVAATIGEILAVELERPRDRLALAHDTRFADYRAAVFEFLYRKQLKRAA